MENPMYLTVTALTKYIKAKLEQDKHLTHILIKGEISNFKRHSRGHFYFTLKDETASISCIMFSRDTQTVNFDPKAGDHVLIEGRMSLYEPSGSYSIQVRSLSLDGIGELYLKYEKLKKELEMKGYFDASHKKPIPKFPKKIGVVTSPTGAVIEDIRNTVSRRYLLAEIHLYPALVQGPGSAQSIKNQILLANEKMEVDVLIVGRGGGSIEDLWGFNELPAIEAIYQSKIPVITAIGHETDTTLSDFVGDLRAPTPTAAAELATPNTKDLIAGLDDQRYQMKRHLFNYLEFYQTKLMHLDRQLEQVSPKNRLAQSRKEVKVQSDLLDRLFETKVYDGKKNLTYLIERLKTPKDLIEFKKNKTMDLTDKLNRNVKDIFNDRKYQFEVLRKSLSNLSPLALMDKGYALIKKDDHVLTSVADVHINDQIEIELKDGFVETKVIRKEAK